MGYGLEVDMIRVAHERDLLTAPYVFDVEERRRDGGGGRRRARAAHGAHDEGHDRRRAPRGRSTSRVALVQAMHDAADARSTRTSSCSATAARSPSRTTPRYVLERTDGVVGFFGASRMERLPTEIAMTENMRRFKALTFDPEESDDERSSSGSPR